MEVKWIKISTDIFNDEKISIIEGMPDADADSIIIIWFKLLCLAGRQNNNGIFKLTEDMPFTEDMFAAIFRRPVQSVRKALAVFESLGMIEIYNNVVTIPSWEKHQNIEGMDKIREQTKARVQKYREKQKLLAEDCNASVTLPKHNGNAIEEDKELDKNKSVNVEGEKLLNQDNNQTEKQINNKRYPNISLSDDDYEKLKREMTDYCNGVPSYQFYLEYMSDWGQRNGKTYTYFDIKDWYNKDKQTNKRVFTSTPPAAPSYEKSTWAERAMRETPVYRRKDE